MNNAVRSRSSRQAGVSLIEMIVVLAIIGAISLVSVPAFMTYYQSAKVKSSMRQFTNDVRAARQRAVTRARPVKMSFETGDTARSYRISDGTVGAAPTWTFVGSPRRMADTVFIHSATFVDKDTPADGFVDIIFRPNGTIADVDFPTETEAGKQVTKVSLRTETKVPYNEYKIYFERTGRMTVQRSSF
jgi:prepilin-type N-terminal cleavage/methylation domain-containing protein